MKRDPEAIIRQIAARQHGAISRAQTIEAGFSSTQIRVRLSDGAWVRLDRGVYAIAGTVDSWERRAMVRVLAAGDGAAASHEAAGYLQGLVEIRPISIDVTVPFGRTRSGTHRARTFSRSDVKLVRGLPVTCVPRTIVDLAGVLPRERLEDVLDRALLRGLASIASVRAYIASRGLGNARGVKLLNELLEDREDGIPETELERRFERVVRRFELRRPDRQIKVAKYRVDYLYTDEKLWIEVNGRRDHGRKTVFEDDHIRHNAIALELADHLHLKFTWNQVTRKQSYVADAVRRGLSR